MLETAVSLKAAAGFYDGSEFIKDNTKGRKNQQRKGEQCKNLNKKFNDIFGTPRFGTIINWN